MRAGLILIAVLILHCDFNFPTNYSRIDGSIRNIVFVYDNNSFAEGAPGDTVHVSAYFAGDTLSDLDWSISTFVVMGTIWEDDSIIDSLPLEQFIVKGSYREFSHERTDSIIFDLVIPYDIIRKHFENVESMASLFPSSVDQELVNSLKNVRPVDVIDVLEYLAKNSEKINSDQIHTLMESVLGDSAQLIRDRLPVLLQALTVNMRLFAVVNETHKVESYFSVRYNSRLTNLSSTILVNRNPGISMVSLYKIEGENRSFNGLFSSADTIYRLTENDNVIPIESGYSYYLVASCSYDSYDSGMVFDGSGQRGRESYIHEWFYRNDTFIPDTDKEKLLKLEKDPDESYTRLIPPSDIRMDKFSIWIVVRDFYYGERLRPVGFAIRGIHGRFQFSEDYGR